mgnify:CR=1 FL=1
MKLKIIGLLRTYENKQNIECQDSMRFYRLRLQSGGKLTAPMIEHIFRFIWFDLDQPKEQVKLILERFRNPPDEPERPEITLETFM